MRYTYIKNFFFRARSCCHSRRYQICDAATSRIHPRCINYLPRGVNLLAGGGTPPPPPLPRPVRVPVSNGKKLRLDREICDKSVPDIIPTTEMLEKCAYITKYER